MLEGVFTPTQKQHMIRKLADTMVSNEGENMRPVPVVILEDTKRGDWGIGGKSLTNEPTTMRRCSRPANHEADARPGMATNPAIVRCRPPRQLTGRVFEVCGDPAVRSLSGIETAQRPELTQWVFRSIAIHHRPGTKSVLISLTKASIIKVKSVCAEVKNKR